MIKNDVIQLELNGSLQSFKMISYPIGYDPNIEIDLSRALNQLIGEGIQQELRELFSEI